MDFKVVRNLSWAVAAVKVQFIVLSVVIQLLNELAQVIVLGAVVDWIVIFGVAVWYSIGL